MVHFVKKILTLMLECVGLSKVRVKPVHSSYLIVIAAMVTAVTNFHVFESYPTSWAEYFIYNKQHLFKELDLILVICMK